MGQRVYNEVRRDFCAPPAGRGGAGSSAMEGQLTTPPRTMCVRNPAPQSPTWAGLPPATASVGDGGRSEAPVGGAGAPDHFSPVQNEATAPAAGEKHNFSSCHGMRPAG